MSTTRVISVTRKDKFSEMSQSFDELNKRARLIVRGTEDASSGWYNSPDDLESVVRDALHWAYWMGVRFVRDALAPQCAQDVRHGPPFAPGPLRPELADSVRLDWIEATGSTLRHDGMAAVLGRPAWYTIGKGPNYKRPRYPTAREAIDAAMSEHASL